ncbi:MAG: hypothetical protein QM772_14155 [Ottowia sp.]|uniref:hypothetical protein n=1 Tax=Ottowia sp. TaxID=1898956 RepID=UPI0039E2586D
MIAILILLALALWIGLGYLLWKLLLRRLIKGQAPLWITTLLFAAIWLTAPWADEYLGQKEFARLCTAMPDTQFFGPVSIGEGPFFDAQGKPKWENRKQFDAIADGGVVFDSKKGNVTRFDQMFKRTEVNHRIADWPVPVLEQKITYSYAPTGQPILVSYWRGSPGGWLKRTTGFGSHAPYQCGKKTPYPHEQEWIKF